MSQRLYIAVRANRQGTAEIYGVYTDNEAAKERLEAAVKEASQRQFWQLANGNEFVVVEGQLGNNDDGTPSETLILSSPASGIFTAGGM